MAPKVTSLDHLVLTVADIGATLSFYENALGMQAEKFTPVDGSERWSLTFGRQKVNLHQAGAEFAPHAMQPTTGSADLCFLSEQPIGEWKAHFEAHDVEIIDGPVVRTGATGPILSVYVRDPDDNLIEVSHPV